MSKWDWNEWDKQNKERIEQLEDAVKATTEEQKLDNPTLSHMNNNNIGEINIRNILAKFYIDKATLLEDDMETISKYFQFKNDLKWKSTFAPGVYSKPEQLLLQHIYNRILEVKNKGKGQV